MRSGSALLSSTVAPAHRCALRPSGLGVARHRECRTFRQALQGCACVRDDCRFPIEAAIVRLVGAILIEQTDERAVSRRHMSLETLAGLCDEPTVKAKATAPA